MNQLKDLAVKVILTVLLASILFRCAAAGTNHTVGGAAGWDLESNISTWLTGKEFHVGDNLVFVYSPTHDVQEVDDKQFENCNISRPIVSYREGNTVISLEKAGTRYFVCGTPGHCEKGMKLQVDVPDRVRRHTPHPPDHHYPPPPKDRTHGHGKDHTPPPGFTAPGPNHSSAAAVGMDVGVGLLFPFLYPHLVYIFFSSL